MGAAPQLAARPSSKDWQAEALAVALVVFAALLFFRQAFLLRGVFFHYDHALQNFPYRAFFARGLAEGRLPLWSSDLFCGFPLFAEGQGNALYPPFILLFALLPSWVAYNYYTVLHFIVAGLGAYALARVLRIGRTGSCLAGIAYMLAGPVLYHAHHTNIVVGASLLPVLLLTIEMACRRRALQWFLALSAVTAGLVLGAQPQYTLYCALTCAIYAGWRLILLSEGRPSLRVPVRVALGLAAAAVLGALLAAVQVLPTLELAAHSSRGMGALSGITPGLPANLLTMLLPFAFGSPGLASYWGATDPGLYSEITMFFGVGVLMLALVGLFVDRSRRTLFLAGLTVFSFLFALGFHGAVYNLFAVLPGFGATRFPSRYAFVTALCFSLLAGTGLQHLIFPVDRMRLRRSAVAASSLVLVAGIAVVLLCTWGQRGLQHLDYWDLAVELPFLGTFDLNQMWRYFHEVHPWDVWRLAGAAVTGTGLLLVCVRAGGGLRVRRVLAGLWIALVFVELAQAGSEYSMVTDQQLYEEAPPLVQALRELPPGRALRYRYYDQTTRPRHLADYPFTPGWAVRQGRYIECLDRMPPNSNLLWEVPTVDGFSPLQTVALKAALGRPHARSTLIEHDLSPVLDLLGVRYVLSPRYVLPGEYQRLFQIDGINVFRNERALPRAFIVHRGERTTDGDALRRIAEGFDSRDVVLVHDEGAEPLAAETGRAGATERCSIESDEGDRLVVNCRLQDPGYLVLADQHFPGWSVSVDGRPARLLRANYLLRAVRLPAGEHVVVFRYKPRSFVIGRTISLLALGAMALGIVACALPQLRGRPASAIPPEWTNRYTNRSVRLLLLAGAVFLLAGPALRPGLWSDLPRQIDPRSYSAQMAAQSAAYAKADGHHMRAYVVARDAAQWWPQNPDLRKLVARYAESLVLHLQDAGLDEKALTVAAEAFSVAPAELRDEAPAVAALASGGDDGNLLH